MLQVSTPVLGSLLCFIYLWGLSAREELEELRRPKVSQGRMTREGQTGSRENLPGPEGGTQGAASMCTEIPLVQEMGYVPRDRE